MSTSVHVTMLLGAMENWDLVTYRERVLLVNPVNTSQVTKQYVAPLIHKFTLFDHVAMYSTINRITITLNIFVQLYFNQS